MKTIPCKALDSQVSALGFGCASLGSRISAADGLKALGDAYERGVNWFDVAPAYGDGQAETLLGDFLRSRRSEVVVCTKVGLAPGTSRLGWLKPLARKVLGAAGGLRGAVQSVRPKNTKLAITPALVEESLTRSLARLNTDYVDVLALHDPDPAECADPALIEALAQAVKSGRVRAVGVAGSVESAAAAAATWSGYGIAQVPGSVIDEEAEALAADMFLVLYSVLGVGGALSALDHRLRSSPADLARLSQLGYAGATGAVASAALLDCALALNPNGVVLCSMFNARHLAANCERAAAPSNPAVVPVVRDILAGVS